MTYNEIVQQFKSGNPKALYLLQGEEAFYIEKLVDLAADCIIPKDFRDFNQTILYARDTKPDLLLDTMLRLPIMAERQLVILKEAQVWNKNSMWEPFEPYFERPASTTVFIIAHPHKKFDKRVRTYKLISKIGGTFESETVKDYKLAEWIGSHVKQKGRKITDKGVQLIAECVGNDLGRLDNELEKLNILVAKGEQITEQHIEKHIGISKDYNAFELGRAVLEGDVLKANKIIQYFSHNPKAGPMVLVLASLTNTYRNLFKAHFLKSGDPAELARISGLHPFVAREFINHKAKHPPRRISRNFSLLRRYDLMSKGYGSPAVDDSELMKELVFQLLH